MTDRGILFSAPMVRALLDGRKTMTRRLAFRADGKLTIWQKVRPNDRLWVRETWKPHSLYAGWKPRDIPQSNVFYRADDVYAPSNTRWVPAIHMPLWASRLTLTVTAVKVEPAQAISEADALAEGIFWSDTWDGYSSDDEGRHYHSGDPAKSFAGLWMTLHGDESWFANPDVVAMSFTVEQRNIDRIAA